MLRLKTSAFLDSRLRPVRFLGRRSSATILAAFLTVGSAFAADGAALTYTVLHQFTGGSDGGFPDANVIRDSDGSLYGTTAYGGSTNNGTIFKLAPPAVAGDAWTETVLYSFSGGTDGAQPTGGLAVGADGALYGTADNSNGVAAGVVFRVTKTSTTTSPDYTVIHAFQGPDGANPICNLFVGPGGALYGVTANGGSSGVGTVWVLTPPATTGGTWSYAKLYEFRGPDGSTPYAGVIMDGSKNLYGTTAVGGGHDLGTVYRLSPPVSGTGAWSITTLYSFQGGTDGTKPYASLLRTASGSLFGTTLTGGAFGLGTAFELDPPASAGGLWTEKILHTFSGTDGANPNSALSVDGTTRALYGTTTGILYGYGNVFKLIPPSTGGTGAWTESVLYSFLGSTDGAGGFGSIVFDGTGGLYSTAYYQGAFGQGNVFELHQ